MINGYIDSDDWNISKFKGTLTSENLPDLDVFKKIPLEPGTPYRFRISALNACGRGDYGEVCIIHQKQAHSASTIKYSLFDVPSTVFILQNMLPRLSGCSVGHQNIKIIWRSTSNVGSTTSSSWRNIGILCIFSCPFTEQRNKTTNSVGIRSCLCWSNKSVYSGQFMFSHITRW